MSNPKQGFSLFEVLIAFAIMTMVLAVLLPGQTRFLERLDPAEERVLALDYAISLSEVAMLDINEPLQNPAFIYRDWLVAQSIEPQTIGPDRLRIEVKAADGTLLAELEALFDSRTP